MPPRTLVAPLLWLCGISIRIVPSPVSGWGSSCHCWSCNVSGRRGSGDPHLIELFHLVPHKEWTPLARAIKGGVPLHLQELIVGLVAIENAERLWGGHSIVHEQQRQLLPSIPTEK
jgi:hypothetical protein